MPPRHSSIPRLSCPQRPHWVPFSPALDPDRVRPLGISALKVVGTGCRSLLFPVPLESPEIHMGISHPWCPSPHNPA